MWIRAYLIVGALLLLSSCQGAPAEAAETATPGVGAYMPLVFRQPTLTPTVTATPEPTPTPTATPAPRLRDGNYEGTVPSPGEGWIWFIVADGGNRATNGDSLVRGRSSFCYWESMAFDTSPQIINGEFEFWLVDQQERTAALPPSAAAALPVSVHASAVLRGDGDGRPGG